MDGSYPGRLHVWEALNYASVPEGALAAPGQGGAGPPAPQELATRWLSSESLCPRGSGSQRDGQVPPYTLDWYLHIEKQRHDRYARWIPRLLEFTKHSGETLLGFGNGLGTDWAQYAQHGAALVVCCSEAESLALTRRNFELRGLKGRFLHATPDALPLENASIDVVCINQWLHGSEATHVVEEVHRVLKPGGKVLAVVRAHYDIDHWLRLCFPWQQLFQAGAPTTPPTETRFTRRVLRQLFARFSEHRIHKRHLRRRELPHVWRWLPLPLLERWCGHFLILKAFKPVSAILPLAAAA